MRARQGDSLSGTDTHLPMSGPCMLVFSRPLSEDRIRNCRADRMVTITLSFDEKVAVELSCNNRCPQTYLTTH